MSQPQVLETPQGRRIAYHQSPGIGPGIVFLGGLKSDMQGTKAVFLEDWANSRGRAFLRFDYSGHGESSGKFVDGCIGDWAEDAFQAITTLTEGPQILVGSSMGGWVSLLLARRMPERLAGLVGIAAAPDFTEDGYWAGFSDAERDTIMTDGQIAVPSDYDEDYIITRRLIEDGREQLVLRTPLEMPFPVRLLQGTADTAVPVSTAVRLLEHASSPDMRLILIKDADHRLSAPEELAQIRRSIEAILAKVET